MKLKVTALRKVTLRAKIPSQTRRQAGRDVVIVPSEKEVWVELAAGDIEFTGLVLGVHPRCLPDENATHIAGIPMVLLPKYTQETLPQEFFGLFRMELSG